jgi:hypothetical protein
MILPFQTEHPQPFVENNTPNLLTGRNTYGRGLGRLGPAAMQLMLDIKLIKVDSGRC